jgi:hypothetical protein
MSELRMQVIRNKVLQYYQLFCNLSLDVVGGVICNMLALVSYFNLNPPLAWYIALPAGTWLIYLSDHVVDVLRIKKDYPTPRHQFIKKHVRSMIALCILLTLIIAAFAVIYFDRVLFISGLVVGGVILLHFTLSRINPQSKSVLNNKELGVSFIYATSIFIYPIIVLFQTSAIDVLFYLYILFLLITYQNLLLCSIIEYPYDVMMNNTSFIRSLGISRGKLVFTGLSLSALSLLCIILFRFNFYRPSLPGLYFLIMAGNYVIYLWNNRLQKYLLYRKLAELLFWLPVLSLIF